MNLFFILVQRMELFFEIEPSSLEGVICNAEFRIQKHVEDSVNKNWQDRMEKEDKITTNKFETLHTIVHRLEAEVASLKGKYGSISAASTVATSSGSGGSHTGPLLRLFRVNGYRHALSWKGGCLEENSWNWHHHGRDHEPGESDQGTHLCRTSREIWLGHDRERPRVLWIEDGSILVVQRRGHTSGSSFSSNGHWPGLTNLADWDPRSDNTCHAASRPGQKTLAEGYGYILYYHERTCESGCRDIWR